MGSSRMSGIRGWCGIRWRRSRRERMRCSAKCPHEILLLDLYGALRPLDAITGATTRGRHPESDFSAHSASENRAMSLVSAFNSWYTPFEHVAPWPGLIELLVLPSCGPPAGRFSWFLPPAAGSANPLR